MFDIFVKIINEMETIVFSPKSVNIKLKLSTTIECHIRFSSFHQ